MDIFNTAKDLRERGYALRDAPFYLAIYDPSGDGKDFDSVILLAREEWRRGELHDPDLSVEMIFRVMMAQRMAQGLEVPDKVARILALNRWLHRWRREGKSSGHAFGVETNGVGYGIAANIREKVSTTVFGYTTVGQLGDKPYSGGRISMPRLAALDLVRVMMEMHRLKSARNAPGLDLLSAEMNAFVWRGRGRPEAMEGEHDDLVMALAGGLWLGTKIIPPLVKQKKFPQGRLRVTADRTTSSRVRTR